ncbi:NnrS family protein [Pseudemcibacter aquimaris]|uniref:NnrS family protein n=1 Tax=Pseudemcibacter aquimaris TaxID=2857064 RepID=UPI002012AE0A|nr:NnrS family protein [Pseudemcibacter aquimaris]MCC3862582.1 NnrS family protein [Pseudemcibacter aquimaris]WDU57900.1 NnrS family protein [Pseudemcibacter aquimaris]
MFSILFSAGFRVFFPLGALGAIFLLPYWVLLISGNAGYLPSHFSAPSWHQHEMIFGVFAPIIIGFLFTAVPNWTGKPSPAGLPLALLALLWVLGRVSVFYGGELPVFVPVVLDVALLPLAIMGIAPAIFQTGNKRNYFLPVMLSIFAIFNLCSHLAALEIIDFDENNFFVAALLFVVMLMNVIGGRVAPSFLKNKYGDVGQWSHKALLPISMISIVVTMLGVIFDAPDKMIGVSSLIAGIAILIRIVGWKGWVAIKDPLMIILHIGVLWIAVGFFLMSYAKFIDDMFMTLSYHAFSIGAAGSLTLGVMTRAMIGHSGRPMNNEFIFSFYFVLINIAALSRIIAPLMFDGFYIELLSVSGVCWVLAYLLFLLRFIPLVVTPRV